MGILTEILASLAPKKKRPLPAAKRRQASAKQRTWNGDRYQPKKKAKPASPRPATEGTWWLGLTPAEFYSKAHDPVHVARMSAAPKSSYAHPTSRLED